MIHLLTSVLVLEQSVDMDIYHIYILYHANCNMCRYELWFIFIIMVHIHNYCNCPCSLQLEVDSHCDVLLCFLV